MPRRLLPLLLALPAALGAQAPALRTADSLMRAGQVFRAESLYYLAVRREPRSPEARLALGRYLAARGALKVGAVLMEEARFFGGDPAQVARELAPVYARMGDYRALAMLPSSPLGEAERARADWLRAAPPSHQGPDSVVIPFRASGDGLGTIAIAVGRDTLEATVDPTARGLVLDTAWRRREGIRTFGATRAVGVVPSVRIGALTMTNVSTAFAPTGRARRARIGLDALAAFTPTFDAAAGRATLRRGEWSATRAPRGERVPTLLLPSGLWLVRAGGVVPLAGEPGRAVLGDAPWTLQARRGEIVVGR